MAQKSVYTGYSKNKRLREAPPNKEVDGKQHKKQHDGNTMVKAVEAMDITTQGGDSNNKSNN
eukprot:9051087-Ditylum_brightwellii.AAC.1